MSHLATPAAVWIKPHIEPLLTDLVQVIQEAASSMGGGDTLCQVLLDKCTDLQQISRTLDVAGMRSASVALDLASQVIEKQIRPGMDLEDPLLAQVVEVVLWSVFHTSNLIESLSLGNVDDPSYSRRIMAALANLSQRSPVQDWELFSPQVVSLAQDHYPQDTQFQLGAEVHWVISRLTVGLAAMPALSTFLPGLAPELPQMIQEVQQLSQLGPQVPTQGHERCVSILRRTLYGLASALRAQDDREGTAALLPSLGNWPEPLREIVSAYGLVRALPRKRDRQYAQRIMSGLNVSVVQATVKAVSDGLVHAAEDMQTGAGVNIQEASAIACALDFMGLSSLAREVAVLLSSSTREDASQLLSELALDLEDRALYALSSNPPVFKSGANQLVAEGLSEKLLMVKSEIQSGVESLSEGEAVPSQLVQAQDGTLARISEEFAKLGLELPSAYMAALRTWLAQLGSSASVSPDQLRTWAQAYAFVEYAFDALRSGHRGAADILFSARTLLIDAGFDPQPGQPMEAPAYLLANENETTDVQESSSAIPSSEEHLEEQLYVEPVAPLTVEEVEPVVEVLSPENPGISLEQKLTAQDTSQETQYEPVVPTYEEASIATSPVEPVSHEVQELAGRDDLPPHIRALLDRSIAEQKNHEATHQEDHGTPAPASEFSFELDRTENIEERLGQFPEHETITPEVSAQEILEQEFEKEFGRDIEPVSLSLNKGEAPASEEFASQDFASNELEFDFNITEQNELSPAQDGQLIQEPSLDQRFEFDETIEFDYQVAPATDGFIDSAQSILEVSNEGQSEDDAQVPAYDLPVTDQPELSVGSPDQKVVDFTFDFDSIDAIPSPGSDVVPLDEPVQVEQIPAEQVQAEQVPGETWFEADVAAYDFGVQEEVPVQSPVQPHSAWPSCPAGVNPVLILPFDGQAAVSIEMDMRSIFAEEINEEIISLREWTPALFDPQPDPDMVYNVRKSFHTIKGSGRMVGATSLGEMAWAVESVLNRVMEGRRPLSENVIALVLHAQKLVEQFLDAISDTPACWDLETINTWAWRLENGEEVECPFPSSIDWSAIAREMVASGQSMPTQGPPTPSQDIQNVQDIPEVAPVADAPMDQPLTPQFQDYEAVASESSDFSLVEEKCVAVQEETSQYEHTVLPVFDIPTGNLVLEDEEQVVQFEGEVLSIPGLDSDPVAIELVSDEHVETPWQSAPVEPLHPAVQELSGLSMDEPVLAPVSPEQHIEADVPDLTQWTLSDEVPEVAPVEPVKPAFLPDLEARISSLSLEPLEGEEPAMVQPDPEPDPEPVIEPVKPSAPPHPVVSPVPAAPVAVPPTTPPAVPQPVASDDIEPMRPKPLSQDVLLSGTDWKVLLAHVQDQAIALRSALANNDTQAAQDSVDRQILALDRLAELVLVLERTGNQAAAKLKSMSNRQAAAPAPVSPPVVSPVKQEVNTDAKLPETPSPDATSALIIKAPPVQDKSSKESAKVASSKPQEAKPVAGKARSQKKGEPVAVIHIPPKVPFWKRLFSFGKKK